MKSMTARLFGLLMLATGIVWVCGMAWIYVGSRKELERVLDVRLEEATRMVSSLISDAGVHVTGGVSGVRMPNQTLPLRNLETNFRLACQIWSVDGRLVGKSSEAPATQFTTTGDGYSDQVIDGTRWRVYAREDRDNGIRVLVGDSVAHRERLVRELMWGLAIPGIIVFCVLSALLWFALRQGLEPLRRLTAALASRSPDALDPLEVGRNTSETRPVVDALNDLFEKVVVAREHERSVTAFAAHELRTPLAGLRTQVQVALAAADPATRYNALRSALTAADRTNRMATQLLAMAQLDAVDPGAPQEWINLGARLRTICDRDPALAIDEPLFSCRVRVNPDAFHMAVRNLTENALQHTAGKGEVRWSLVPGSSAVLLTLDDAGPGIPEDELQMVTRRFFRGRNKSAIGSGLGLAIAQTALDKDGLSLNLQNRTPGPGLRAQIVIPTARVAFDAAEERAAAPQGFAGPSTARA
ncbi:MAG: ATP-binding protein [Hyphomicrobium sp.]|jgi:two-component system sensor histidine kinase QseC